MGCGMWGRGLGGITGINTEFSSGGKQGWGVVRTC